MRAASSRAKRASVLRSKLGPHFPLARFRGSLPHGAHCLGSCTTWAPRRAGRRQRPKHPPRAAPGARSGQPWSQDGCAWSGVWRDGDRHFHKNSGHMPSQENPNQAPPPQSHQASTHQWRSKGEPRGVLARNERGERACSQGGANNRQKRHLGRNSRQL